MFSVQDCHLDGHPIPIADWPVLNSAQLASIVGSQQPGSALEHGFNFVWEARWLPLSSLQYASQDGDMPPRGWAQTYQKHLADDAAAIANGSPEYAGRDEWMRQVWLPDTRTYPLFVVKEFDGPQHEAPRLRLLDGHHRLAGAFYYQVPQVFTLVGTPLIKNTHV